MKHFLSYRAHKQKLVTWQFFSAIIELDQELVTSNMQNKFEQDKYMPTSKC